MDEASQEDIISMVNTIFEVNDFTKTEFSLEFQIKDFELKTKFEELARKLENMKYACKLEQMGDWKYIIIQKFTPKKQRKWLNTAWTPRILFVIVISFIAAATPVNIKTVVSFTVSLILSIVGQIISLLVNV